MKSSLNSNNLANKKISLNNIMSKNDSLVRKNSQNNNTSLNKLKNKNIHKKKILIKIKQELKRDNHVSLNKTNQNENMKERKK